MFYFKPNSINTTLQFDSETITDDVVFTGSGRDRIDVGNGTNYVNAGAGNDLFIHDFVHKNNTSDKNTYLGGSGHDKIILNISAEDLQREDVKNDLKRFEEYKNNAFKSTFMSFNFESMNLRVKSVEDIDLNVLEARDDKASMKEDEIIEVNVVENDSLTAQKTIALVSAKILDNGKGSVDIKHCDKIVFDSNNEFDYLAEGEQETIQIEYVIEDTVNHTTSTAILEVTVDGVDDSSVDNRSIDLGDILENNSTDIFPTTGDVATPAIQSYANDVPVIYDDYSSNLVNNHMVMDII